MRRHVPAVRQQRHRPEGDARDDLHHHHREGQRDHPASPALSGAGTRRFRTCGCAASAGFRSGACSTLPAAAGRVQSYTSAGGERPSGIARPMSIELGRSSGSWCDLSKRSNEDASDKERRMPTGTLTNPALAQQLLDALDALSGLHPGFRPAHAKGLMCSGTFTPSPEAAKLTRAPHASRPSTPVTVRYSNSTGRADHPRQRPGTVRPAGDRHPLPPGRPRPHRHRRPLDQRLPGPHRRGVPGVPPRRRRRRRGPARGARRASSPPTRTRSGSSKRPSRSRRASRGRRSSPSRRSSSRTPTA